MNYENKTSDYYANIRKDLVSIIEDKRDLRVLEVGAGFGETMTIRANGGAITFDNTKNIFLTNKTTFSLANGEVAVFMKIDNVLGTYYESYQLISVMRASTP